MAAEELKYIPVTVASHVQRLARAIGEHVEAVVKDAVDRAIAALASPDVRGGVPEAARETVPEPAVAAEQGSASPPPRDLLEDVLGPEITALMTPAPAHRDVKPQNVAYTPAPPVEIPRPRIVLKPKPEALEARAPQIAERNGYTVTDAKARLAELAKARIEERRKRRARAVNTPPPVTRPTNPEPENPNAKERWTAEEIELERDLAEANKLDGTLPVPSSTWELP